MPQLLLPGGVSGDAPAICGSSQSKAGHPASRLDYDTPHEDTGPHILAPGSE